MTMGLPHLSQTSSVFSSMALTSFISAWALLQVLLELLPELVQGVQEVVRSLLDLVQLLLHGGGVLDVHDVLEVLDQEVGDQEAELGGPELGVPLLHVLAGLDGGDDRGVGRGAADAVLLELLHEAGLAEARRRLGEVLVGVELLERRGPRPR